ncbi:hydrogenase expression/formation protein HypC [Lebetimonas natsushimae]|uniref:Hydrogenase expression/formation protein HypC n=1 Tax=Lebetimonas natsushimae TaxID=1936991 RepID=A0A292YED9_9BACT|nr:HypC/HybG/HupF family hydrogenase formation chaperone [Lebetimonas natsushimae]GAX87545.1 hydrogenase expression/formation protein HypC [Lebetimonas natsushimae]
MCLAIPSKVLKVDENNMAEVDTLGVKRTVSLDLIQEEVKPGDYVLIHVGYAMSKIDEKFALESIEVYKQLAEAAAMEEDAISPEKLVNEDGPLLYKPKAEDE